MTFGNRLRQYRKQAGLTQAQLAEMIGTSQNILTNYETGSRRPLMGKIPAIAKALGVSVDALYGTEEDPKAKSQPRTAANSREKQMQEVFRELTATQQRAILQQAEGLLLRNMKT